MRGATKFRFDKLILSIYFNPRSPCGERLSPNAIRAIAKLFQPTLPMRGATAHIPPADPYPPISTHAPHAGSDETTKARTTALLISTHAPHAGSDMDRWRQVSTAKNFNPRSPCGERLQHIVLLTISLPDIVKSHSRKQKRAS